MRDPGETEFDRVWEQTEYAVESPAGWVRVTMTGDRDVTVWVDPSWFARASKADIETELARAARLVYVERTRAYYETSSRVAGMEITPVQEYVSDEQRRYFEGLRELHAEGASADGRVRLTMVGLSSFAVHVETSALEQDAGAFTASCREAALACLADHTEGWQRLHFDVYTRPKMERAGLL